MQSRKARKIESRSRESSGSRESASEGARKTRELNSRNQGTGSEADVRAHAAQRQQLLSRQQDQCILLSGRKAPGCLSPLSLSPRLLRLNFVQREETRREEEARQRECERSTVTAAAASTTVCGEGLEKRRDSSDRTVRYSASVLEQETRVYGN